VFLLVLILRALFLLALKLCAVLLLALNLVLPIDRGYLLFFSARSAAIFQTSTLLWIPFIQPGRSLSNTNPKMVHEQHDGHCIYCGQASSVVVLRPFGYKLAFCKECINNYWKEHYKSGNALNQPTPGCEREKTCLIHDDWKDYVDKELLSLAASWKARAK
jgi:hypothetical protein